MRKINEIFYSLQGEGYHSGQAAIFVRFSGCNLECPFCDTNHREGTMMTDAQICREVASYPAELVILTGGEPSLGIDDQLIEALHSIGKYVCIETNGTHPLPQGIDWITFSPKIGMTPGGESLAIQAADEIKVVNVGQDLDQYFLLPQRATHTRMYLQPCYVEQPEERAAIIADTISKVKSDPRWQLSAQLHRLLSIP